MHCPPRPLSCLCKKGGEPPSYPHWLQETAGAVFRMRSPCHAACGEDRAGPVRSPGGNFGRKCLFLVGHHVENGQLQPGMCRSGAEGPFAQRTAASQEGALSWPGAERHGLRSTFLPFSTSGLAMPLLRASLGAAGTGSLIGRDLGCSQVLFWALGKDSVLEVPVPPGKAGASANPGSGDRK